MIRNGHEIDEAAGKYWSETVSQKAREGGLDSYHLGVLDAFAAGAAWQKERDSLTPLMAVGAKDMDEVRNAIGTLGEGMAAILQGVKTLQEAGLRGADRGVAILKHLQEVGDNVRNVNDQVHKAQAIGVDVGKKVDEVQSQLIDIEMIVARVEGYVEEYDGTYSEATTEPMHADVKAADYYDPGKPSVPLGDVDDDTLRALAYSGQISTARYAEEINRRSYDPRVDYPSPRNGIVTWEGKPYMLAGGELHPLRVMP